MVPAKGEGEKGGAAVGAAGFRVPSRGEVRLNSARDADRWRPERTRSSCVMRSETQSGICWLNSLKKSTQTSPPFSLEAADRRHQGPDAGPPMWEAGSHFTCKLIR
ncbi:transmembrane protein 267 isoform X6 [Dasypus novemcinctus]|uniref:transmembrane protein 267 isoform X6 n=1 Tax=Dasypus novemcinctus TaxID=9361 RepID=UPI0039C8DDB7